MINGRILDRSKEEFAEFCYLFADDNRSGSILEGADSEGFVVTVYLYNGVSKTYTVADPELKTYIWIEKFAGISAP